MTSKGEKYLFVSVCGSLPYLVSVSWMWVKLLDCGEQDL